MSMLRGLNSKTTKKVTVIYQQTVENQASLNSFTLEINKIMVAKDNDQQYHIGYKEK